MKLRGATNPYKWYYLKMKENQNERAIDTAFKLGILLKGIDGVLEVAGSIVLIILGKQGLNTFIQLITRHELAQDPRDFIANHLIKLGSSLSIHSFDSVTYFLLLHGLVKITIVILLFLKKIWAYPLAIVVFTIFGLYQIYQMTYAPSFLLLSLTILDFIVVILTYLEYRNLKIKAH